MAPKIRAVLSKDKTIIISKGEPAWKNAQEFKLSDNREYSSKVKSGKTIGRPFEIKSDNFFLTKNPQIEKGNFNSDKRNRVNNIGKGNKGSKSNQGSDFKGKSGQKKQKQQSQIPEIKQRPISGFDRLSSEEAIKRVANKDFREKDVANAFYEWARPKDKDGKNAKDADGKVVEIKKVRGKWGVNQSERRITEAVNDYEAFRKAAINSKQNMNNQDYEAVMEENRAAVEAGSDLPESVRSTETVGAEAGRVFGKDGYTNTILKNYTEASRKIGVGINDEAYKEGKFWWSKPSVAAQIEKSNLEAEKIGAEADVEEAKALKEEGIERAARSKSVRLAETEAEKRASASFVNKMTFGLLGRDSLATLRVKAERAEAEAALKTAKQEGRAAEESAKAQRRAISVQSGAFGARERAQRLEQKELERLEQRSAEGRPISKADKARLKFIREFSEETPSSFARGEAQVRSVVAPNAETVQAAKDWERRKRGSKK